MKLWWTFFTLLFIFKTYFSVWCEKGKDPDPEPDPDPWGQIISDLGGSGSGSGTQVESITSVWKIAFSPRLKRWFLNNSKHFGRIGIRIRIYSDPVLIRSRIRIRMDIKTRIRIRIRTKSVRIHNTGCYCSPLLICTSCHDFYISSKCHFSPFHICTGDNFLPFHIFSWCQLPTIPHFHIMQMLIIWYLHMMEWLFALHLHLAPLFIILYLHTMP